MRTTVRGERVRRVVRQSVSLTRTVQIFVMLLCAVASSGAQRVFPYGSPGAISLSVGQDSLGQDIIAHLEFSVDSLLTTMTIPVLEYREEHEYLGSIPRKYIGVPPQIQEALGPVRPLNRFTSYLSGIAKGWGVGTPHYVMKLHNFAIACTSLTRQEYDVIRVAKAMTGMPELPEDVSEISLKYCATDYRDGNEALFLRCRTSLGYGMLPEHGPMPDDKNDSNRPKFEKGVGLAPPSSWSRATRVPDARRSGEDREWLHGDSTYWLESPLWWKPTSSSDSSQDINTAVWQNDGVPWSQGSYIQYDSEAGVLYLWEWRRQWYDLAD